MQIESSLRASDADRDQVAERLRHATVEGRLTADELDGRLRALFAARTYGEIDALLADLPAERSPGRQRVGAARWPAAVAAFTLMLAALGALIITRVHSAIAVGGPGPRQLRIRPPLPDSTHGLIAAASIVAVFAVLLACGVLVWVLRHPTAASEA